MLIRPRAISRDLSSSGLSEAATVENLAALKALTSRPESVIVKTGQAAGTWQWEAGSSTTADDGTVVQCTSGTAGRYKRVYDGPLNALWFGASPSNTAAQNVTAFNAACAAAAQKTLFIPAGYYLIDGTISVPAGTYLVGEGGNDLFNPTTTGTVIGVTHTSGPAFSVIDGVVIDGVNFWWPNQVVTNPPTAYDYAIYCDLSGGTIQGPTIKNVVMYNAYNGIDLNGSWSVGVPTATNLARMEHVYGCFLNIGIHQNALRTEATMLECNFSPVWWLASAAYAAANPGNSALSWMTSSSVACYHIEGGQGIQITGGTFFGHRRGIYGSNPGGVLADCSVTFLNASNFIFDGLNKCVEMTDQVGLLGARFDGCTFLGSDRYGVASSTSRCLYMNDSQNSNILEFNGCSFYGTQGHHVEIVAPTSTAVGRYKFSGCFFYGANANSQAGTFYNVYCDDTRAQLVIEGAYVYNPTSPAQIKCFTVVNAQVLTLTDITIADTASQAFEISSAATYMTVNGVYSRSTVASVWPSSGPVGIASASTVTLWEWDMPYVTITGTTTITSIALSWTGRVVTLKFSSAGCTVTDGGNLILSGNFVSAVNGATLTLACDGTNWVEVGRSNSTDITIASGTLTASDPAINITQTWNNAGVDFNSFSINNTDTASNISSTFASFRTAGVAKFNFFKDGTLLSTGNLGAGYGVSTGTTTLSLGSARTGDGIANIDLVSDTTYTSGGLRIVRNAGANGASTITHRGTGGFGLIASEAATFTLTLNSVAALTATSTGVTAKVRLGIDGASGTSRELRFTTSGVQRWSIAADSLAESGTRTGTQFLIAGFDSSGAFTNVLGRGERGSGPLDNGAPVWAQFAPLSSTINAATSNRGVGGDNIYRQDTQPTTTLGSNPITTTNGSSLVSVAWTGALSVLVDATSLVNFSGATAVGGVTLSGWLPVTSVTTNAFVVESGTVASSSATGGGAAVAIIPSFTTYNSKKSFNVTTGASGFPINDGRLMYASPSFFTTVASGQQGTKYENRWSVIVGPDDTSALNTWTVAGEEINVINRGETDKGYFPSRFVTPRLTEGVQIVAFDALLGAPGGGSFTHCDFGHSINAAGPQTRWYHGYTVSPNTLVGLLQDTTTNHGGVGHEISGSYTYLNVNPFASIAATSTIRVTAGSGDVASLAERTNGDSVYIPGTYTLNGVSFGDASYTISNINLTTYTFDITGTGIAASSGSGGGLQQVIYFAEDVPYAPINISGEWAHGIVTDTFSKFDDGLLISTQAGNGIGWSTTPGTASINATAAGSITLDAPLSLLFEAGGVAALGVTSTAVTANVVLATPATTTSSAGLRLPHGTAPSSPVDGDMWTTTAGLYVRINGVTVGPLS